MYGTDVFCKGTLMRIEGIYLEGVGVPTWGGSYAEAYRTSIYVMVLCYGPTWGGANINKYICTVMYYNVWYVTYIGGGRTTRGGGGSTRGGSTRGGAHLVGGGLLFDMIIWYFIGPLNEVPRKVGVHNECILCVTYIYFKHCMLTFLAALVKSRCATGRQLLCIHKTMYITLLFFS